MPTVLRINGYRLFFYSLENNEPPHIHIEKGECVSKYWLDPVALAMNRGFRAHELNELRKLVGDHRTVLKEAWDAHFSG